MHAAMAWQVRSATGVQYASSLGTALVIDTKNDAKKCSIAIIAWRVEYVFASDIVIS